MQVSTEKSNVVPEDLKHPPEELKHPLLFLFVFERAVYVIGGPFTILGIEFYVITSKVIT